MVEPDNSQSLSTLPTLPIRELLAKSRIRGRIDGLRALKTDAAKSRLLKDIYVKLTGPGRSVQRVIGMLEVYIALEPVTAKKKIVQDVVEDLERRQGKW